MMKKASHNRLSAFGVIGTALSAAEYEKFAAHVTIAFRLLG